MEVVYAYPGTFCPPHKGHVDIAKRIAQIAGKITVVCSVNEKKNDRWFTPEECKKMWEAYNPGKNVKIATLAEFMAAQTPERIIVMVRGIRDEKDLEFEKKILEENRQNYGIENYHYLVADEKYRGFSSTKARDMAMGGNLEELEKIVHPQIAAMMIEKSNEIKEVKK